MISGRALTKASKPHGRAQDARLLQRPDPPPAGGGRGADDLGERRVAEAGVGLQCAQDAAVDVIKLAIGLFHRDLVCEPELRKSR
jgi:hypothetical protein